MSAPGPPSNAPDIWQLMFEQTPTVIRWLLGVLTLGTFTLLGVLWRWSRRDIEMIQKRQSEDIQSLHSRMSSDIGGVNSRISSLEQRIDDQMQEMNHHLITIASNTGRKPNE